MKEFVEKLMLEELKSNPSEKTCSENILLAIQKNLTIYSAIEIVNQLAEEYNNGWIPCSERLPEYTGEYNVTVVVASELGSFEDVTTLRFENIKGKEPKWVIPKDEIYRVIAWMELPEKYQKGSD